MPDATKPDPQRRLAPFLLGTGSGLIVGAGLTSLVFLLILHPWDNRRGAEPQPAPVENLASRNHPPDDEVLDYLDGKPFPLPDDIAGVGGGKPGGSVVIRRKSIKQLAWESSSWSVTDPNTTHRYALLYDAGDVHYVAELHVNVRQVGTKQAYLGFQATGVQRADKVVDAGPK
jgi:hypothetical protein